MFFGELVVALLVSALIVTLLTVGLGRRGPGAGLGATFALLFLATWAGGVLMRPVGPPLRGVSWLSFLLVGLFVGLLVATLVRPGWRPRTRGEALRQAEARDQARSLLNVFFWVLISGLLVVLAASYLGLLARP
jgi:hypothetical protein